MRLPVLRSLPLLALFLAVPLFSHSQSLKVNDPTHLAAGINRGTLDSFVGEHYWDFWVNPGRFQLVFSGSSPQEGFSVGRAPAVAIAFVPKTPGAVFTERATPGGGMVFSGSVTRRTRVGIVVEPAKSPLVRQTTDYTLSATGSVDFGGGASAGAPATGPGQHAPSVAGAYAVASGWTHASGVAKLTPDGSVVTTSGGRGMWELFDADSRTYVVTISGDRRSLTFQPGRGFIDAGNGNIALEMKR